MFIYERYNIFRSKGKANTKKPDSFALIENYIQRTMREHCIYIKIPIRKKEVKHENSVHLQMRRLRHGSPH